MEHVIELLTSRVRTDVCEAVVVLAVGSECGVEAAEPGVRQMVHLVWTKDEQSSNNSSNAAPAAGEEAGTEPARSPREHVMHAYKTLFLTADPALPTRDQAQQMARNLFGCVSAPSPSPRPWTWCLYAGGD
jgi:condensin complex subunit 1